MLKILIADDHSLVRKTFIKILKESYPVSILGEASCFKGIFSKLNERWDLIILDINLYQDNGYELLKRIKQFSAETPVLHISLNNHSLYARRSLKLGAAGFLTKECAADELVSAVMKITSGKRYVCQCLSDEAYLNNNQLESNKGFDKFHLN
jgi:two-component system, NarL family, invasion response regulator UvrY